MRRAVHFKLDLEVADTDISAYIETLIVSRY
jgi:hypothetical protein